MGVSGKHLFGLGFNGCTEDTLLDQLEVTDIARPGREAQ